MASLLLSSAASSGLTCPLNTLRVEIAHNPALAGFAITKINHYKEKDAVAHEFLVLTLFKGVRTLRIRVERRPSTQKPIGITIFGSSSYERLTDDGVTLLGSEFDPSQYHHISSVDCPPEPRFTLQEMSDICDIINQAAPNYNLSSTHCYWFCAAFLLLLQHKPGMEFIPRQDYRKRGRYRGWKVVHRSAVQKQLQIVISGNTNISNSQLGQHMSGLASELLAELVEEEANAWTLHKVLEGHESYVYSVAFTPDGGGIVSGSEDGTVWIWSSETGGSIGWPLKGHTRAISAVAVSPNGHWIASASGDKTIRIWDLEAGTAIGEPFSGHTDTVTSVAFSSDSHQLVSGSLDNTLQFWDVQTGKPLGKPLKGHTGWVNSVAFSPDGRHIVSGSVDATLRIWNARTGQAVGGPLVGHTGSVTTVAFSPDGTQIVSGSGDKTICLWDARIGRALGLPLRGHTDWVRSVTFSPNGRYIASGSADHTIRIWDIKTGKAVGEPLQGHTDWVMSVAFSPNGQQIASGSDDDTICIWNQMAR